MQKYSIDDRFFNKTYAKLGKLTVIYLCIGGIGFASAFMIFLLCFRTVQRVWDFLVYPIIIIFIKRQFYSIDQKLK